MSETTEFLARLSARIAKEAPRISQEKLVRLLADSHTVAYNRGIIDQAARTNVDLMGNLKTDGIEV